MRFLTRVLATLALIALFTPAAAARTKPLKGTPLPKLQEKARKEGQVAVIIGVRLDEKFVAEGALEKEKKEKQRGAIQHAQEKVARKHGRLKGDQVTKFRSVPHMLALVDEQTLLDLAEDDDVVRIDEERVGTITMNGSTAHVNAPTVWNLGYNGNGWAVAQLDTGVQKTHPMLNGKVAAADEGCFARNFTSGTSTYTASCPNNDTTQTYISRTGDNAATPCAGLAPCNHGTQTAAIAVGQNGSFNNTSLHGVARGSSLVPINVITFRDRPNVPREIASFEGDHLRAFDFIIDRINAGRQIASVNISLDLTLNGYTDQALCDGRDSDDLAGDDSAYYQKVQTLRSYNVLVVAGAGNRNLNAVGFPACLSNALAVGATGRASDDVASYSNAHDMLDLWAPGGTYDDPQLGCTTPTFLCITTAFPGSSYISSVGTSFAAPHVAGAVAVLRGRMPNAPLQKLIDVLTGTGPQISDARTTTPRRRLDLSAAYNAMDTQAPTAPTVNAFATNSTTVKVELSNATDNVGIAYYRVQRRSTISGGWSYLPGTFPGPYMEDTNRVPGKAYEYRAEAYDAWNNVSPFSGGDVAVTVLFAEDPIAVPGTPRLTYTGQHLAQLREAIDAWRELAGLNRLWGSYANVTGVINFAQVNELTGTAPLRGFDEARAQLGRSAFVYSEGAPQQGGVMRASHVQDLRQALK